MEELVIRSAVTSDAAGIAAIYAPYVRDTAFSFEDVPPTATQMAGRIEEISNSYPFLVAERGGVPVGYAYGTSHRSRTAYRFSADVSIYLDASA
ncbi:Acetyltransferase (GNAT) domain-containing protein [Pelagibacterium luteolum]|uniref:Acetyltransferase (GNAT) domain-containing protein n=1 Tax=Pelagibacterium luteolum TaxID=440168 RepID=A0A1G7WVF3_9HYPH|nr:Acetyltransferase (GNAT) domain-containing protein [Pelagibacterium luteolum]